MQSAYLSGDLEGAVFDKFTRGELDDDKIRERGCEPGWDVNFIFNELVRCAGAAGPDNQPVDVYVGP